METKQNCLSKRQIAIIVVAIFVLLIITCLIVLSFFYTVHGLHIYRKNDIWEYRVLSKSREEYMIQTFANLPEIVAPLEMFGHKVTHIYANNANKIFLPIGDTSIKYCHSYIIILTAVDPNAYYYGLKGYRNTTSIGGISANILCVPQESAEIYKNVYNFNFQAANVSYLLNYEQPHNQGYYYVSQENENKAKEYVYNHLEEFYNNQGRYDPLLVEEFIQKEYGVFIDTSNYNGGYYWVDYLKKGDKILTIPDNPKREGYIFTGWYLNQECTISFDFNSFVKDEEPIVLYARWEQK